MAKDEFGFDDAVIKILTKKENTIVNAENDLLDSLTPIEKKIFDAVQRQVSKMNKDGANLIFDDKNVNLLNEIDKIIADQLKGFAPSVKDYLRNFETIKQFNFDAQKSVNDLSEKELEDLVNPIQKAMTQQTIDGLTGSGVNSQFIEPVKQGIFKNIVAGSTITDLESALRTWITTTQAGNSLLRRYVTQVSRDALNQFDGQVNSAIAQEYELDAFRYVGSLIDDSRAQCIRWSGKGVVLKDQLETEIAWAFNNGTGMIPGTNKETYATFRGGYNCRHSAIPFKMTPSMKKKFLNEQGKEQEGETKATDAQINQVEKQVNQNQKDVKQAEKKKELNPGNFLTTQNKDIQNDFNQVLNDSDDFIGLANGINMNVSLRTPSECTKPGTDKLIRANGLQSTPGFVYRIGTCSTKAAGCCYEDNSSLIIKIQKDQKILFKKYDIDTTKEFAKEFAKKNNLEFLEADDPRLRNKYPAGIYEFFEGKNSFTYYGTMNKADNKFKFFTMSSVSRIQDNNIAPTITHEIGHAFENAKDPKNLIKKGLMSKLNLKLSDAPTIYGESNIKEFWTESFSAYVYANDFLKKNFPKNYEFVEEYLKEMNIDLKTIKIAQ